MPVDRLCVHQRISEIPRDQWNALIADNNPFIRHEWLQALEDHQCVGAHFGWLPRHLAVYRQDRLMAAMPLYEKTNSYGEFVFDHAWAQAWQRAGLDYYPKLVVGSPYTPAAGQRLLTPVAEAEYWYRLLCDGARQLAGQLRASGVHWLFPGDREHDWLVGQGFLARHDCQFHWRNRGYRDFEDFLSTLISRKRKTIRQERRRVAEAGVTLRVLDGHQASAEDWHRFSAFYRGTFDEKWGVATLNQGFFEEVARLLPDQVVLVLADRAGRCVAGALMYRGDSRLYGRYWGCSEQIDCLHFEACYYQGIDYCIREGLQCFEPGAQGEHKIARGFVPTRTRSAHWLADNPFQQALRRWVDDERQAVAEHMNELGRQIPYRDGRAA